MVSLRRIFAIGFISLLAVALLLWFVPDPVPMAHPYFTQSPQARAEIIAHRGGQTVRPANTLLALSTALAMGADALEVDARLTADGILVLRHDDTLDRTTDMRGLVADKTLAQLRLADAGVENRFGDISFAQRGITIPSLAEALAQFPQARWVIEIKDNNDAAAEAMCDEIRQAKASLQVLVGSFHDDTMNRFRAACPEVATSMASDEATRFVLAAKLRLAKFLRPQAQALQIPLRARGLNLADSNVIAAARAHGVKVQFWTINRPEQAKDLLALGVDGLITDDVAAMRRASQLSAIAVPSIF